MVRRNIVPIEGYRCGVCGVEMMDVSEREDLEHANTPKSKYFRRNFAYVAWIDENRNWMKVNIVGKREGLSSSDYEPIVHGREHRADGYIVSFNGKVKRRTDRLATINTRGVRCDFEKGLSRFLTEDEAESLGKELRRVIYRMTPSMMDMVGK